MGEVETRSGKIRLRGPAAHASTAHALSMTCFYVYNTDFEFDNGLHFAFANAVL